MMKILHPLRLLLLGVLLTLLGLEGLLRLLPVSTATMVDYHVAPTILTYPPHLDFTVASGWDLKNARHLRSNNFGFVDNQDFTPDPGAVAVIGDSFVEANMLAPDDRIGPALSRALDGTAVYSMGGPGSSLLDYAERARLAAERLNVQRFVFVLELGDVQQVLCGSGNHHGPCIDPRDGSLKPFTRPSASGLKTWARHSALAQYVFSQLKFNPARLWQSLRPAVAAGGRPKADPMTPALTREIVTRFLDALPATAQPPILLIDGPRGRHSDEITRQLAQMAQLRTLAEAAGARVIDLAPHFAAWRAANGLSLEVGPYDGHWNPVAHRIAAEAAAEALRAP
ncbi:SDR family oxidoreductase [Denitromonas iodatirespirans]|uniref:Uncharacterized protein n=1 Tax=Denitromonas iodatirespirans TaxID=2795389 RepID=A0A944DED9_DENI1|nr:SDR family oxidoreductase [Denitromonas iodatirespirans]MBT0961278.1 hypothetical protein [Denitromonas iodatirespirans]